MNIYTSSGTIRCKAAKYHFHSSRHHADTLTAEVCSPYDINFSYGDYVTYNGYTLTLQSVDTTTEQARQGCYGDARHYRLTFSDASTALDTTMARDMAVASSSPHSGQPLFSFLCRKPSDVACRIMACLLSREEQEGWTILIAATDGLTTAVSIEDDDVQREAEEPQWTQRLITISEPTSVRQLLNICLSGTSLTYTVTNRTIRIGYRAERITTPLSYGRNNGLRRITRTADYDNIVTRLRIQGAATNIASTYYQQMIAGSQWSSRIPKGLDLTRLQLPHAYDLGTDIVTGEPLQEPRSWWHTFINDSEAERLYGIHERDIICDGTDPLHPVIYPMIGGVVDSSEDQSQWSAIYPDGQPTPATVSIVVNTPDYDYTLLNRQDDAAVVITSGRCEGIRLIIQEMSVITSGKTLITMLRTVVNGLTYPNALSPLRSGDGFELYGVAAPQSEIETAERRLSDYAMRYLAIHCHPVITTRVAVDRIFLYRHPEIQLRAGKELVIDSTPMLITELDERSDGEMLVTCQQ